MARPRKDTPKENLTFRIDPDKKQALDHIAALQDRDRSYILNEAIAVYLDVYRWQVAHIEEGLRQAKAGETVSHEQVKARWEAKRAHLVD